MRSGLLTQMLYMGGKEDREASLKQTSKEECVMTGFSKK
jgi:hypothetical protein